jgi:hypothetical protein
MTQIEEESEIELFIQHQMEQEEQDKHDLKLFHEQLGRTNRSWKYFTTTPETIPETIPNPNAMNTSMSGNKRLLQ